MWVGIAWVEAKSNKYPLFIYQNKAHFGKKDY